MEILSGEVSDRPRPPPGRRYLRRRASFSLSPSDMFLFRPPKPTYVATSWPGDLCVLGSTVCLALERVGGASKVLLFCHGTSSDLGSTRRSLEVLRDRLGCHVVGVEYPGYGLTADGETSEASVNAAVRVAFVHLTEIMGWPADRVVVMGRSLGSGPAARLAKEFRPAALFLLAPFTGVGDMAGSIVGETLASMFNLNQWNNKEELAKTTCPTLVLHGLKDQVVPHTHSLELYRASGAAKKYVGLLLESDHNRIDWHDVCELYAKPFMEMACPQDKSRSLGIRADDVAKLSNFTASGTAAQILVCAEAAWAHRDRESDTNSGAPSGGTFQPARCESASSPSCPTSAISVLSTSVLSVSPPRATPPPTPTVAGARAAEEVDGTATKRRMGGDQTSAGWSFWPGTGKRRSSDEEGSGGGSSSSGGGGKMGGGGWGGVTVRSPACEPTVMGTRARENLRSGGGDSSGGDDSCSRRSIGDDDEKLGGSAGLQIAAPSARSLSDKAGGGNDEGAREMEEKEEEKVAAGAGKTAGERWGDLSALFSRR